MVNDSVRRQLVRTGALQVIDADNVLPAGGRILASLRQVFAKAQAWLENV
ncbi:unnamed protein product [marine sediment metagenome]|uniref:Uncharacterized protein n=1 Tax=marine sediment metagenome TaxID=412755 RepID=X0VZN4_9ZZZZ